jgi:hypothetical protein
MKTHTLSTLLLVAGATLILLGYFEPQIRAGLVIVVADDTPPEWMTDSGGGLALNPKDGSVYGGPVSMIQASVKDLESGVTSVVVTIDQAVYSMTMYAGDTYTGSFWKYSLATPITSGQHSFSYVATNGVELTTRYTGSFSFSTAIQGTWYVNGIEITSSTQTVYSPSLTVNFTFSRSSGSITSTLKVTEGGMTLVTLTSTDSMTWRGSYTFAGGQHTLVLTASEGVTTPIIMATLSVDFGGVVLPFTTEQLVMFAAGACCLGGGGYLRLPKKKR